jgi:parvulin-like peptidyl-prolyl isomerase
VVGKIIAVVNGDAIYLAEFENNWVNLSEQTKQLRDKELSPEEVIKQKEMLLNQMVEDKLLAQEAKRKGIKVPKRELEEGIASIKNRFKNIPPGTEPSKDHNITKKQF